MAKKRALEPESEVLLRKEHDRVPPVTQYTTLLVTCYYGHNFINTGEVCTSVLSLYSYFVFRYVHLLRKQKTPSLLTFSLMAWICHLTLYFR